MTLFVLFFGTLFADDVFVVVQATWPIVRYKNGTVGVKNDGGAVQVQSTDLLVDGNLSVSGSLFVQDRDLVEYEERVSSLENAKYEERVSSLENAKYEDRVAYLEAALGASLEASTCVGSTALSSKPSSLTHWIDFSTSYMQSLYGMGDGSNIATFEDLMGNAADIKVHGEVKYTPNAQNGLGAIYIDASLAAVTFRSNTAGRNPEIFIAFNVVKQSGYISGNPHGLIFLSYTAGAGGYGFGPYKTQENYFRVIDAAGVGLMSDTHASFNSWHIVNIYWGDEDGFVRFDGGEFSEFDGIKNFQAQKLEYVGIGGTPVSPNHHTDNYVGEVLIFNEKLSESDRSMVTSYLMSKWGISCAESSIDKPTSVVSQLQSLTPPKCIPPGGDKLRFDGEKWICVCINSYYYGDECQYKTPYEPVQNLEKLYLAIRTCLTAAPIHGLCYDSPHGPMPEWNVSLVTSLYSAFNPNYYCCQSPTASICHYTVLSDCIFWAQQNPDISKWDTASVTDMSYTFGHALSGANYYGSQFNQNISQWDTSSVTTMYKMFRRAKAFNQYVGDWDTSSLTGYYAMFDGADAFQAKYTCASSTSFDVKPSSCKTVRSTWIAPPPPPSLP